MISHWFHPEDRNSIRPERLSKNSLWHQVRYVHDVEDPCTSGDLILIAFDRHVSKRVKKNLYQFASIPGSSLRILDCGIFVQNQPETLLPVLKEICSCGATVLLLGAPLGLMKNLISGSRMVSVIRESNLDDDIYLRTVGQSPLLQYIGTQRHLISESNVQIEGHLRLSELREELGLAEPCLRDSDVLLFNCDSLSAAEAGYLTGISSSGLTVMEACQLFRYAGASQSLNIISIYGYSYESDENSLAANSLAQMIWYLMEGSMLKEDPEQSTLTQYIVQPKDNDHTLKFYKSEVSGRWWIENRSGGKIPCSYQDYRKACEDDYSGVVIRSILG